jgi:hypothetical protein
MRALTLIVAACVAVALGCGAREARSDERADSPGAARPGPQETKMLTDEEAIAMAREAVSDLNFSKWAAPPTVERDGDRCTVTFPIVQPEDEEPELGPDYDAKVEMDCRLRKITQVFVGS